MIAPNRNTKKLPYLAGYAKRKICVFTFSHDGKSIIKTSPHYFVSRIMIIHGFYGGALCVKKMVTHRCEKFGKRVKTRLSTPDI